MWVPELWKGGASGSLRSERKLCSDVRKAACFRDISECLSKTSAQKLRARYSTRLMLFSFFHKEHLTLGTDVQNRWADEFD